MNLTTSSNPFFRYLWLFTFGAIIFLSFHQIANYDIWWHMATARYVLEHGKIITTDVFNFTTNNTPWYIPSWLHQILFFLGYIWGGANLIIGLKTLIVGGTFFLAYKNIIPERRDTPLAIFFIFTAYIGARYRFVVRPYIFYYFYALSLIYLLNIISLKQNVKLYLGLLALIVAAWVNAHGTIVFAYVIVGTYFVEHLIKYFFYQQNLSELTKFIWALLLVFLASLFTPYSYQSVIYPFKLLKLLDQPQLAAFVAEAHATSLDKFFGLLGIFILISPLVFLQLFKQRKFSAIFLLIGFGFIGMTYGRFTGLFFMIAAPIYVNAFPKYCLEKENEKLVGIIIAIFLFVICLVYLKPQLIGPKATKVASGVNWDMFPDQAARFINENLSGKRGLNTYGWGGYLEWALYPQKTFIDGRGLSPNTPFIEWKRVFESKSTFDRTIKKYNIDYVIWDKLPQVIASKELNYFPPSEWRLVFWDKKSVIYLKNTSANQEVIKSNQFVHLRPFQTSSEYLLELIKNPKTKTEVFQELEKSLTLDPENARVLYLKAVLQEKGDSIDKAIANYKKALEVAPHYTQAAFSLGLAFHSHLKDLVKAREYYQLTLDSDPEHFSAWNNLALLALAEKSYPEAEEYFQEALKIKSDSFLVYYNLVRVYKEIDSPKLKKVYQWLVNNPNLIPRDRQPILEEARQGLAQ